MAEAETDLEAMLDEGEEEEVVEGEEEVVVKEEEEEEEEESEEEEDPKEEGQETEEEPGFEDTQEAGETSVDLSQLNKDFPGILKKHPAIREMAERELQYRELYPKLGDASDSLRKGKALDDLNREIFTDGSISNLLSTVNEQDKSSLQRIARSLPEDLFKLDKEVYFTVAQPIVNEAIAAFAERVEKNPDENIRKMGKNFASAMAKFINGNKLPDAGEQKVKDVEERDKRYYNSRVTDANAYVGGKVIQTIEKNLDAKLSGLTDYMKQSVKKDILERVNETLSSDSVFQSKRAQLWKTASDANFAETSLDTIVKAMLSQVKGILPRVRAEVLEKAGAKPQPVKKTRKKITGSSTSRTPAGKKEFKSEDYDKYSDADILAM